MRLRSSDGCTMYNVQQTLQLCLINRPCLVLLSLWGCPRYICYRYSLPDEQSRAHPLGAGSTQRIRTGSAASYRQAACQHGGTDGQLP